MISYEEELLPSLWLKIYSLPPFIIELHESEAFLIIVFNQCRPEKLFSWKSDSHLLPIKSIVLAELDFWVENTLKQRCVSEDWISCALIQLDWGKWAP